MGVADGVKSVLNRVDLVRKPSRSLMQKIRSVWCGKRFDQVQQIISISSKKIESIFGQASRSYSNRVNTSVINLVDFSTDLVDATEDWDGIIDTILIVK